MEDLKWLLRKCGLLILLLLIFVIVGVICWGKMHEEEQKVAEEVWEPPVEIENSEAETEEAENAETSTESAYWFIPQASDCLISDEEKEQLQSMVLSAADSVAEIYKDIVLQMHQVILPALANLPTSRGKLWWSNWAEAVW